MSAQYYRDESRADGLGNASRISCPVLVVNNRADLACTPSHAQRLFDAELALSIGRAARTDACKAHLARMKEFEAIASRQFEAGRLSPGDRAMAQYYALDAEIRLERVKTE